MTLCARVFDLVAMAECVATGHRWVTVRPWGDVAWRECRRCGQTGQALQVVAENEIMSIAVPAAGGRESCDGVAQPAEHAAVNRGVAGPIPAPVASLSGLETRRSTARPQGGASVAGSIPAIRAEAKSAATGNRGTELVRYSGDGGERPALSLPISLVATEEIRPRWSRGNAERDEAIVRMAGEGFTHAQIAAVFGVHRTLIRHVLERVTGVSRKRPDHTQRDADIARRVAAGSRCADVARETGMTPSYVSKIVRAVAARQKETA